MSSPRSFDSLPHLLRRRGWFFGMVILATLIGRPVAIAQTGSGSSTGPGSSSGSGSGSSSSITYGTTEIWESGTTTDLNGGTFVLAQAVFNGGTVTGGIINAEEFVGYSGDISARLIGTGALTKSTADTLTLSGYNTYEGGTTVTAGTLAINDGSQLGYGSLTLTTGGHLTANGNLFLDNSVTASGADTSITTTGNLGFGVNDVTGNLLISDGATVTSGSFVAIGIEGTGEASVTGIDSTLTTPTILHLGADYGTGTLTVGSGGIVNAGQVNFAVFAGTGTLNLETGGTLRTGGTDGIVQTGTANFNLAGGTIEVTGTDLTTTVAATLTNTSTIDTNGLGATFGGVLSGEGSLTKTGAGTLTLSTGNIYAGLTTISEGTLALGASGTLAGTSTLNIASGATFDGSALSGGFTLASGQTVSGTGSIVGAFTAASGAIIAPGNSPGTLTFSEGLTLDANSIINMELGSVSDMIAITGGDFVGPSSGIVTINLTNSGGFASGVYTLFDYSGASSMTSISAGTFTLGSVISGYTYQLAISANTLQLTASAVPEPAQTAGILSALAGLLVVQRRRLTRQV